MLNKNDPLIGAVQEVMNKNHAEREAVKLVNEYFGIQDRKVLPHERQHEWNEVYNNILSEGVDVFKASMDAVRNDPTKINAAKEIASRPKVDTAGAFKASMDAIRNDPTKINAAKEIASRPKVDTAGALKSSINAIRNDPTKINAAKEIASRPKVDTAGALKSSTDIIRSNAPRAEPAAKSLFGNSLKASMDSIRNKASGQAPYVHKRKMTISKSKDKDYDPLSSIREELKGNQHKIDANKNGRVDGGDFPLLKKGVRPVAEEGDPSKAIRGDDVTGGNSVTVVKPKPKATSITPADQSALKKKIQSIKEENLEEKAVSKAKEAAASMSAKSVKDYAKTKQKGLPEKVDEATDAALETSKPSQVKGQTQYGRYKGVYGSMQAHADAARAPVPAGAAAGSAMGSFKPAAGPAKKVQTTQQSGGSTSSGAPTSAGSDVPGKKPVGSFGMRPAERTSKYKSGDYAKYRASQGPSFEKTGRGSAPAAAASTPARTNPGIAKLNAATSAAARQNPTVSGTRFGGASTYQAKTAAAAKPADRPNDLGKAGVPGTGGKLAPAAPKPTAKPTKPAAAAPKQAAKPAAKPATKTKVVPVKKPAAAVAKPKGTPASRLQSRYQRDDIAGPKRAK